MMEAHSPDCALAINARHGCTCAPALLPTAHFRFVKRYPKYIDDGPLSEDLRPQRILQQFWCQYDRVYRKDDYSFDFDKYPGEWRDVPLVEE